MVLGCASDTIVTPMGTMHKENIGIMVVTADILSILVITYFIVKIKEINAEFVFLYDNLMIMLSDYTIQI